MDSVEQTLSMTTPEVVLARGNPVGVAMVGVKDLGLTDTVINTAPRRKQRHKKRTDIPLKRKVRDPFFGQTPYLDALKRTTPLEQSQDPEQPTVSNISLIDVDRTHAERMEDTRKWLDECVSFKKNTHSRKAFFDSFRELDDQPQMVVQPQPQPVIETTKTTDPASLLFEIGTMIQNIPCKHKDHSIYKTACKGCLKRFVEIDSENRIPAISRTAEDLIATIELQMGLFMTTATKRLRLRTLLNHDNRLRVLTLFDAFPVGLINRVEVLKRRARREYVPTGPQFGNPRIPEWITTLTGKFKTGLETLTGWTKSLYSKITECFQWIWSKLVGAWEIITGTSCTVFEKIKEVFCKFVQMTVSSCESVKDFFFKDLGRIVNIVMIVALCIVGIAGILTSTMVLNMLKNMLGISSAETRTIYLPTGTENFMPYLLGAVTLIGGGMSSSLEKTIVTKIKNFSLLVAGGAVLSSGVKALLFFLPTALKTFLTQKFGTLRMQREEEVKEWMLEASALVKISGIPKVLVSPLFLQKAEALLSRITDLIDYIRPEQRQNAMSLYTTLQKHVIHLTSMNAEEKVRPLPFAFHIAGRPGVGKSVILPKLIKDLFGENVTRYDRPAGDEYWSGYTGAEIIVYDEFMATGNNHTMTTDLGLEYLNLVSTSQFKPNMASVDSPSVGMKGTTAAPKAVITLNNQTYNEPASVDFMAFQRRRKFVVEIALKNNVPTQNNDGANVDLQRLTKEQRTKCDWAAFRVLPGVKPDNVPDTWFGYRELIDYCKDQLVSHDELVELIRQDIQKVGSDPKTAEDYINDAMKLAVGIPTENLSFKDMLSSLIGTRASTFVPCGKKGRQARSARRRTLWTSRSNPIDTGLTFELKQSAVSPSSSVCGDSSKHEPPDASPTSSECGDSLDLKPEYIYEFTGPTLDFPDQPSSSSEAETFNSATSKLEDGADSDQPTPYRLAAEESMRKMQQDVLDSGTKHSNLPVPRPSTSGMQTTRKPQDVLDLGSSGDKPATQPSTSGTQSTCKQSTTPSNLEKPADEICVNGTNPVLIKHEDVLTRTDEETLVGFCSRIFGKMNPLKCVSSRIMASLAAICYPRPQCPSFWDTFLDLLKNTAGGLVVGTVVTGVVYLLVCKIASFFTTGEVPDLAEEFSPCSPGKTKIAKSKSKRSRGGFKSTGSEPENTTMYFKERDGQPAWIIPLKGKWILGYNHLITNGFLTDGKKLFIGYKGKEYEEIFKMDRCFRDDLNDQFIYEISSRQLPPLPNVLKKLPNSFDLVNETAMGVRYTVRGRNYYCNGTLAEGVTYLPEQTETMDLVLYYNGPTKTGDCGTPVFATSGPLTGRLVGMIVAGTSEEDGGFATLINKDRILDVIEPTDRIDPSEHQYRDAGLSPLNLEELAIGPGLVQCEAVPFGERIALAPFSGLERSKIAKFLPYETQKQRPVLRSDDHRTENHPVQTALLNASKNARRELDPELVDEIFEDMTETYKDNLEIKVEPRILSFEEAVGGIPGLLSSMDSSTSPGFPKVLHRCKKGKKDCFEFDANGTLVYSDAFKEEVEDCLTAFLKGEVPNHRWLGYFKDELVSESKIKEARTRVIYCGDVVATVALRRLFGTVLANFNQGSQNTSQAIGQNQYSYDMDKIKKYLDKVPGDQYVAGDFKGFDQHFLRQVHSRAFDLIMKLGPELGERTQTAIKQHQMDSWAQIADVKFRAWSYNFSGCLFTTLLNGLANEFYWRFLVRVKTPELTFDKDVRVKVHGDDHIVKSINGSRLTGPQIQLWMAEELDQEYTSDRKTDLIIPEHRPFDEITFLGAHPRFVNGSWTGALKKETLQQVPLWTRDKDRTIVEQCTQMIELASQWDRAYFIEYKTNLKTALSFIGKEIEQPLAYYETRDKVAQRTAQSGKHFPRFLACGFSPSQGRVYLPCGEPRTGVGLTTLVTDTEILDRESQPTAQSGIERALQIPENPITYGTDSALLRESISWSESSAEGSLLKAWKVPNDLIRLGSSYSLQDMPFTRFVYTHFDLEVTFQLNGTPFQRGAVIATFAPMCKENWVSFNNARVLNHVILQPRNNGTGTLKIPFRFVTKWLNLRELDDEYNLGTIELKVLSQLADPNGQRVTISLYTRFLNAKFAVPAAQAPPQFASGSPYHACGTTTSKTVNHIEHVAGNVSMEASAKATGPRTDAKVDSRVNSNNMDNPTIGGCSLPTAPKFSSLCKSEGLEPTTVLALKPDEQSVEGMKYATGESRIEHLCSRPSLRKVAVDWTTSTPVGKILEHGELNSVMDRVTSDEQIELPFALGILNLFQYWHADFVLEFFCVRTAYHSGRLKLLVGYGLQSDAGTEANSHYTTVIDFNGDIDRVKVRIPYNQVLEWMRTYEGPGYDQKLYSLGHWKLEVLNILRAPSTVSDSVKLLIFVSLDNVRVALPKAIPFVTFGKKGTSEYFPVVFTKVKPPPRTETKKSEYHATGTDPIVAPTTDEGSTGVVADSTVAMTEVNSDPPPTVSCKKNFGAKFEHDICDLIEVAKRQTPLELHRSNTYGGSEVWEEQSPGQWSNTIHIRPGSRYPYDCIFTGWSGSVHVRAYVNTHSVAELRYENGDARARTGLWSEDYYKIQTNTDKTKTKGTVTSQPQQNYTGATEVLFPLSGVAYIDVTVPFFENREFIPTNWKYEADLGSVHQGLTILTNNTNPSPHVYIGAGDDMTYFGLCPSGPTKFGLGVGLGKTLAAGQSLFGFRDT